MRCSSSPTLLALAALAASLLAVTGCSEPRADTPPVVSAPPPSSTTPGSGMDELAIPFELYGHPGPWWRNGATQVDFDRDIATCRTASSRAREQAASGARKDAAYRAFLECMGEHAWTRGHPPRSQAS